jgi:glucosamine--fructose-6-phosphate aminotransferase (isomerizing)
LNYLTPKSRREVLEFLVTGLKRQEYRGYDSAGVAFDSDDGNGIILVKQTGKVKILEDAIAEQMKQYDIDRELITHCGIAHTRWATHGPPSELNSHPQRSDVENSFVVVHNGIITNYKDVKKFLEKRGYHFESETDTEIIAKLIHHLYLQHPNYSFRELVEQVIQQMVSDSDKNNFNKHSDIFIIFQQEGAFALAFKSKHFPGECVATRRGSPLLVGIKTKTRLATDHIPILYGKGEKSKIMRCGS